MTLWNTYIRRTGFEPFLTWRDPGGAGFVQLLPKIFRSKTDLSTTRQNTYKRWSGFEQFLSRRGLAGGSTFCPNFSSKTDFPMTLWNRHKRWTNFERFCNWICQKHCVQKHLGPKSGQNITYKSFWSLHNMAKSPNYEPAGGPSWKKTAKTPCMQSGAV